MNKLLVARGIKKSFHLGKKELNILRGVELEVGAGEDLCIVGASGAGKSTLLHILGLLDKPTAGRVYFDGRDLSRESDSRQARFRNEYLGFVFQFHHLLTEFKAFENVALPLRIAGQSARQANYRSKEILQRLGLKDRFNHFPSELSGGEQQRVAVARALVRNPKILFADEPTGNLDSANSKAIQDIFFQLKNDMGLTLIVVTHDEQFAERFSRVIRLEDGFWTN